MDKNASRAISGHSMLHCKLHTPEHRGMNHCLLQSPLSIVFLLDFMPHSALSAQHYVRTYGPSQVRILPEPDPAQACGSRNPHHTEDEEQHVNHL